MNITRYLIAFVGVLIILSLIYFLNYLNREDNKCDEVHIDEWTPARDPMNGCDSSLIECSNFLLDENLKLENYIKELEEDNQRLGSHLAEMENR